MNVLQKGGFTVVVATVVASAIILSTGKSAADSSDNSVQPLSSTGGEIQKNISQSHALTAPEQVKIQTLAPPPGPFLIGGAQLEAKDKVIAPETLMTPKAPHAPVSKAVASQVNISTEEAPNVQSPESARKKPVLHVEKAETPEFKREKPGIVAELGDAPKAPVMKPALKVAPDQPIWMQKPPTKPVISNSPAIGGVAPQRYMYIPVPMYQSAHMQYYNPSAGHFIAPQLDAEKAAPTNSNQAIEIKKGNSE